MRATMRALVSAIALGTSLASCAEGPAAFVGDAGPPTLEVGTDDGSGFVPVADGDTLLLAMGCQGLQHVTLALRTSGIDPRASLVELRLSREDGTEVSAPFRVRIAFQPIDGVAWVEVALVVPEPVLDEELSFFASVSDGVATEEVEASVTLAWGTVRCAL